jgi:predicted nucleotide-binding protein
MDTKSLCVDLGWAMARVQRGTVYIVCPRDEETSLPATSVSISGVMYMRRLRDALTEMLEGQEDEVTP